MSAPRWHNDHELLACVATRLHAQRIVGYPPLVDVGRMTPASAADGIRIMGAIACSWWAIADVLPEPDWIHDPETGGAWPFERIAALDIAARRPREAATELPNDFEIVGFADAIDTLIWWETARPSARVIANGNPRLRIPPAAQIPVAGQPFTFGVAA